MIGDLTSANLADGARRVAMLIYPGVAPLDVAGPLQVFGVANFLSRRKLYDVVTVAPDAAPVPTPLGFAFMPTYAMTALPLPVDTLLVSGGGGPDAGCEPAILDWLKHAAPQARRFGSICTGAFALGAAGFIDGKRVTTHWAFGSELARRHPSALVDDNCIFIRDEQSLHVSRNFGGHRPCSGAARGGSWPRPYARRRAISRSVSQARRRPGAVLNPTGGAVLIRSRHSENSAMVSRTSERRSPRRGIG